MTDEQLAWLREHYYETQPDDELFTTGRWSELDYYNSAPTAVVLLLAEVERLRAENATTTIMVRRLASNDDDTGVVANMKAGWAVCGVCRVSVRIPEHTGPFPHNEHCPITLARAILAAENDEHTS